MCVSLVLSIFKKSGKFRAIGPTVPLRVNEQYRPHRAGGPVVSKRIVL